MYRIWFGNDIGKLRIFIWKIYIVLSTTCTKLIVCFLISTVLSADGMVGEKVMRGGSKVKSGTRDQSLGYIWSCILEFPRLPGFHLCRFIDIEKRTISYFQKVKSLKKNYYSRIVMNSRFFYYSGLIEF